MPCSDSSSSISLVLDPQERFLSFDYAKITCGREISGKTGLKEYLKSRPIEDILSLSFKRVAQDLNVLEEENQFILYLEFDALRCALAQYLGEDYVDIDRERCMISSVEHTEEGVEVALVILPPKELPKILPCNLAHQA